VSIYLKKVFLWKERGLFNPFLKQQHSYGWAGSYVAYLSAEKMDMVDQG
jgi:hypothetical protein